MSLLLTIRSEDGEYLTDKEIRDDLVTLVLAGHETTATTLAWMVDLLLHHPDALAKVQAEADAGESTAYTQAVINETLRIRPPSPFTGRYTAGEYRLGGYTVPARTRIVPHIGEVNLDRARHTTTRTSSGRSGSWTPAHRPMPGSRSAAVSSVALAQVSAFSSSPSSFKRCCAPAGSRPCTRIRTSRSGAESCCCRTGGCRSATTRLRPHDPS